MRTKDLGTKTHSKTPALPARKNNDKQQVSSPPASFQEVSRLRRPKQTLASQIKNFFDPARAQRKQQQWDQMSKAEDKRVAEWNDTQISAAPFNPYKNAQKLSRSADDESIIVQVSDDTSESSGDIAVSAAPPSKAKSVHENSATAAKAQTPSENLKKAIHAHKSSDLVNSFLRVGTDTDKPKVWMASFQQECRPLFAEAHACFKENTNSKQLKKAVAAVDAEPDVKANAATHMAEIGKKVASSLVANPDKAFAKIPTSAKNMLADAMDLLDTSAEFQKLDPFQKEKVRRDAIVGLFVTYGLNADLTQYAQTLSKGKDQEAEILRLGTGVGTYVKIIFGVDGTSQGSSKNLADKIGQDPEARQLRANASKLLDLLYKEAMTRSDPNGSRFKVVKAELDLTEAKIDKGLTMKDLLSNHVSKWSDSINAGTATSSQTANIDFTRSSEYLDAKGQKISTLDALKREIGGDAALQDLVMSLSNQNLAGLVTKAAFQRQLPNGKVGSVLQNEDGTMVMPGGNQRAGTNGTNFRQSYQISRDPVDGTVRVDFSMKLDAQKAQGRPMNSLQFQEYNDCSVTAACTLEFASHSSGHYHVHMGPIAVNAKNWDKPVGIVETSMATKRGR